MIAAIFWTWLWGPVGLLLSTPLTLCLVVLGRHVDRLEFFDVMLGSPAFQGAATVDGIDTGGGTGKIVGLDVSLKGDGPLKKLTQAAPVANPNTVTAISAQV